jgi:hypothetical protein
MASQDVVQEPSWFSKVFSIGSVDRDGNGVPAFGDLGIGLRGVDLCEGLLAHVPAGDGPFVILLDAVKVRIPRKPIGQYARMPITDSAHADHPRR